MRRIAAPASPCAQGSPLGVPILLTILGISKQFLTHLPLTPRETSLNLRGHWQFQGLESAQRLSRSEPWRSSGRVIAAPRTL